MANLQIPRGENAVDIKTDASGLQTGSFKSYWLSFFTILGKRFNAANETAAVASPNAAAAPGAYSQAHIQTIVAELNETKAQLNALLTALNT